MDIAQSLNEIERQVGRLSPMQKFLLGTDGSVTQILEAITGNPVVIETRVQKIIDADPATAERLGIDQGDPVNYRIVAIKTAAGGEVLIYAISYTPIGRLSPEFKDDLMKADIPIGRIIQNHRIEARREILTAGVAPASEETGRIFSLCGREPLLSRQYRIIHDGKPLIFIEEQFPYNRFLDERRVIVRTPSRLHLTLIDMHGGSGRVDGSVGITLDEPGILVEVRQSPVLEVQGCYQRDTGSYPAYRPACPEVPACRRECIHYRAGILPLTHRAWERDPAHACDRPRGIAEIYGRSLPVKELALLVSRGGTSGIGTAAFELGGFIIDGGHTFGQGCQKSRVPTVRGSRWESGHLRSLCTMSSPPTGVSCLRCPTCLPAPAGCERPIFSKPAARSRSRRFRRSATRY